MSSNPTVTTAILGSLKRNDLQKLAMANDIKANQKSAILVTLLVEKHGEDGASFIITDALSSLLAVPAPVSGADEAMEVEPPVAKGQRGRKRKAQAYNDTSTAPTVDGAAEGSTRRLRAKHGDVSHAQQASVVPDDPVAGPSTIQDKKGARGKAKAKDQSVQAPAEGVDAQAQSPIDVDASTAKGPVSKTAVVTVKVEENTPAPVDAPAEGNGRRRTTRSVSRLGGAHRGARAEIATSMNTVEEAEVMAQIQGGDFSSSPVSGAQAQPQVSAVPDLSTGEEVDVGEQTMYEALREANGIRRPPSSYGFTTPTNTPPSSPLQLPSNLQSPTSPEPSQRYEGPASPDTIKETVDLMRAVQERDDKIRDEVVQLRTDAQAVTQQARLLQERMKAEKVMTDRTERLLSHWRIGGYYNQKGVEDDYEKAVTETGEWKKKKGKGKQREGKKKEWRPLEGWSHDAIWSGRMRVLRAINADQQYEITTSDEEGPNGLIYRMNNGEDVNIEMQRVHGEEGVLDTLGPGQEVPEGYLEVVKQQEEEKRLRDEAEAEERERRRQEREEEMERQRSREEEDAMLKKKKKAQKKMKGKVAPAN
ncbi:hypothetical protein ONZ45_g2725 [Pleurotus djamor]|nr:hypothetical protein ONZ45_g2725 [Pleurotus djamor]